MDKIAVIVRVYNRISDLEYNLDIIRKTWNANNYYLIVSCNGDSDGYHLTKKTYLLADKIVKSNNNQGHLSGNAYLLLQAIPYIPSDCVFTLILEADTWVYGDSIITKYKQRLIKKKAVWASAKWYDKCYSLATDFALISTRYLLNHPELFDFGNKPEIYVANYILDNKGRFVYIRENMMPNLPSYIHKYPYAPEGRFYIFPLSRMVTHHIELLNLGMDEKKRDFNILSNNYFDENRISLPILRKGLMMVLFYFSFIFPRRSWLLPTTRL